MEHHALLQTIEEKLDLTGLPQATKDTVIMSLGEAIIERTMLTIAQSLTQEEATEANTHISQGGIEHVVQMLEEKHPELSNVVITITNTVIAEFLETSEE